MDSKILEIARAIERSGGRALVVGGYVRDRLLGLESKDADVEVYHLGLSSLERELSRFGPVIPVGKAFGVLRIKGLDADFALPRRDSKTGPGHRGFAVSTDPELDFATASRRRDLTINSMGLDPLTEEILDPHGGRLDLEQRVLRATDPAHFPEDPLRGMRAAQFAARFEMVADPALLELCSRLDLGEISPERVFEEFRKLLIKGARPSLGLAFLHESTLLRFFPELMALIGVAQDPQWHPEGDVWVHNQLVIDEAARLRTGGRDDLVLMLAALCHDLGKPATTVEVEGRVRSPSHDAEGVAATRSFLQRLRAPTTLQIQVCALVRHHLAPALYVKNGAAAKGYRRLARKLEAAHVSMTLLERLARADHLGRTTEEALARRFPAGETFLVRARAMAVDEHGPADVVLGRHLIARGFQPGPRFGDLLARCREFQDELGLTDPDAILDRVLSTGAPESTD